MALNFPPCASYPINQKEGDSATFIRLGNRFSGEMEDSCGSLRKGGSDQGGGHEPVANDILDLLPKDPFGMDLSATFTAAIAAWLEDFEPGPGLDLMWNTNVAFGSSGSRNLCLFGSPEWCPHRCDSMETGNGSSECELESSWDVEDIPRSEKEISTNAPNNCPSEADGGVCEEDLRAPHDALLFSLSYLDNLDLLSAEKVCRSFRDAIRNDSLLWRDIDIEHPLNERITDIELVKLTDRAQGHLKTLSLVKCPWITNDGLRQVLQNNPGLTKLSVPGCPKLGIAGLVSSLKVFNSTGMPGIKCLRIGGLHGVSQVHFEELNALLKIDKHLESTPHRPRFFHIDYSFLSNDDERPIDIETCPRCQNLRLVYDCPVQSCQDRQNLEEQCRACIICIARCIHCGKCINDSEYEETFSFDLVCWNCLHQPPH